MKQYREKMDELRAPDSLRNQTLQAIRQQQAREEEKKPQRHPGRIWIPAVSLAAAACLIITIGFASGMMGELEQLFMKLPSNNMNYNSELRGDVAYSASATIPIIYLTPCIAVAIAIGFVMMGLMKEREIKYNTVPNIEISPLPQNSSSTMTIEEYSAYLGVDLLSLIEYAELTKFAVLTEDEEGTIREDEGTFYYNVQGASVMLHLSKTKAIAPEFLAGKEASRVGRWNVVAGIKEDGNERMAAFECGDVRFFLVAYQMKQQDFKKIISGILEKFE